MMFLADFNVIMFVCLIDQIMAILKAKDFPDTFSLEDLCRDHECLAVYAAAKPSLESHPRTCELLLCLSSRV